MKLQNWRLQSAKIEEQQYITESLDQVMRDMGYNVVGSREVVKKSGRKFRNGLYHFSEGSVVNVTYAANGADINGIRWSRHL